ncbi:MAG: hypothetical protein IJW23_08270 [Lentisphaeria bacterium]|nr:hypothetical protein [Lentisphaeria bacterium]
MEDNIICGALDFSWGEAAFAMMQGEKLLVRKNHLFSGHDASRLPEWIAESAAKAGGVDRIQDWTIGAGPGSFSGLRIASAYVMGLAYGKENVRVRGISTAAAMALTAFPDKQDQPEEVLVLFDGKRSEIIGYGLTLQGSDYVQNGYKEVFRNGEELRAAAENRAICALEKDSAALAPFEANICYIPSIHADALIRLMPGDFSSPPTALEYLRAAVFVPPKTPRQIL